MSAPVDSTSKRILVGTIMGALAKNPMPGGKSFSEFVPDGDLCNFSDRWKWIEAEMIPAWFQMELKIQLENVKQPLGQ